MTDGPQQPYDPRRGHPAPPAPQQPGQPQFPQQAGYRPEPARPAEPDWSALAESREAGVRRRRTLLMAGGGVLAVAAVAGIVATAVVASGGDRPGPVATGGEPVATESVLPPEPTFSDVSPPPPPDPLPFISDAGKDTAPLSADTLFPGRTLLWQGRSYTRTATDATGSCATAASSTLGPVLTANDCRQFIRTTYQQGTVAVTVGVAVFDDKATADTVKQQAKGLIRSLPGGGTPAFCRATVCRGTTNAVGRYAYFTIAGFTDGTEVTTADPRTKQAGKDISDFAFTRIVQRGKDQAAASVATPEG